MRIKITGLPKHQGGKLVGDQTSTAGVRGDCPEGYLDDGFGNCNPDPNYFPNNTTGTTGTTASNTMTQEQMQDEADRIWMGQGTGSKGQPIVGTTNTNGEKVGGTGAIINQQTTTTTINPGDNLANKFGLNPQAMANAAAMASGLSLFGNTLKAAQIARDQNTFGRKFGQTDASNPVVRNVYSRGRNVINTGEYAPNMMTPVQFAGRPTPEYTGYPVYPYNIYAQDGLNVTRDILGLSSLYDNPNLYSSEVATPMPDLNSLGSLGGSSSASALSETASFSGDYALPVKNFKITSGFGPRTAPIKGASSDHNGVDLGVPVNTAVFSPMDGIVEKIYENGKGGKQLIVRHMDGSKSGYAHLNDYNVSIGQSVKKGQQIALSGNTGNSSGPHLHFTFRNPSGMFVDPVDFFNMRGTNKNRSQTGLSNWDHNNPGNIHIEGNFAQGYGATQGRKDGSGHVAIFPTMEAGLQAMQDLIFSPRYSNLTVSQARNRWVNGDPNAATTSTPHIVKAIGADVTLNQLNAQQRKILLEEFVKWEDRSVYDKLKRQGVFKQGGTVPFNNNSMKIKITGTPDNKTYFADGGRTVGDQMGYGLYRGQSVRDFNAFYKQDEDDFASNVKSTEHGVPRGLATIEAEAGEKAVARDGMSILDIKGKKHSQGGTPMDAQPGDYIVSDFIVAPKSMQRAMGFEIESNKKKDNTWAKVLDSKVKSKDYNKLSAIIQAAAEGKEVDRFELAMAKSKLPVYQDYVGKAILGNELTKMMQGKPYDIPEMAMPAMMKLFPEAAEQIMMQQQMQNAQAQQMQMQGQPMQGQPMAKWGMPIPQYQTKGVVQSDPNVVWQGIPYVQPQGYNPYNIGANIVANAMAYRPPVNLQELYPWFKPFTEAKTERGRITRKGKNLSSLYDPSVQNQYQDLDYWVKDAASKGITINSNESLQRYIYNELEKDPTGQSSIKTMWGEWGPTLTSEEQNIDNFSDNLAGARTAFLMSQRKPVPPPETTVTTPAPPTTVTTPLPPQGKKPPEQINPEWDPSSEGFPLRPYAEDVINLGSAIANMYAYPNIGPVTGRYNPVYMDPAFRSTEANRRLLQSQGLTAIQEATQYGAAPQQLAARQAQINAQLIPAMIQDDLATNAQNIQTDMATRQFNAQVANQAALYDAERVTQMNDKLARLAQNRAKEKVAGRTAAKNMLNQMITNAGNTALMNEWYPQYAFDPLTYGVYFEKGKGKGSGDQAATTSTGTGQSYSDLFPGFYAQAKLAHPNDDKKAREVAHELTMQRLKSTTTTNTYDPRQGMINARRQVRTTASAEPDNDGTFASGGFIPMYYVGGWY